MEVMDMNEIRKVEENRKFHKEANAAIRQARTKALKDVLMYARKKGA